MAIYTKEQACQILGVEPNSPKMIVKKKHRELALKYHPDTKNGNEQIFIQIQGAYDAIMNNDFLPSSIGAPNTESNNQSKSYEDIKYEAWKSTYDETLKNKFNFSTGPVTDRTYDDSKINKFKGFVKFIYYIIQIGMVLGCIYAVIFGLQHLSENGLSGLGYTVKLYFFSALGYAIARYLLSELRNYLETGAWMFYSYLQFLFDVTISIVIMIAQGILAVICGIGQLVIIVMLLLAHEEIFKGGTEETYAFIIMLVVVYGGTGIIYLLGYLNKMLTFTKESIFDKL